MDWHDFVILKATANYQKKTIFLTMWREVMLAQGWPTCGGLLPEVIKEMMLDVRILF